MEHPFLVFAGSTFYPLGGAKDLKASFPGYDEALLHVAQMADAEWWQIVRAMDSTLVIVCEATRK